MTGKILAHLFALWTGWAFATALRDFWHHGERYELEQVRARHDDRRETAIEARKVRYMIGGYALFAGQSALFASLLSARGRRHSGMLALASFACTVPSITAANILLPQLQLSDARRLLMRHERMRGTVTDIRSARPRRDSAA